MNEPTDTVTAEEFVVEDVEILNPQMGSTPANSRCQ